MTDHDNNPPDDAPPVFPPNGHEESHPEFLDKISDLDDETFKKFIDEEYDFSNEDMHWFEQQEGKADEDARRVVRGRYLKFWFSLILALCLGIGASKFSGVIGWAPFLAMVLALAMVYISSFPVVMYFAALEKWKSCFFYLILTMVTTLIVAASVFAKNELDVDVGLADALYFSVVTWTTLGFGDLHPEHPVAKGMAVVLAVTGYVQLGVLITLFGAFLQRSPYKKSR